MKFPQKTLSQNIQVIDVARSFSILAVMAGHFNGFPAPEQPWTNLWARLQHNNTYGVCVFFVISGFLITRLIDRQMRGLFRPSFKEFYVRRAARLFPLLLAMVLLGLVFTFVFPERSMKYLFCFKTIEMRFDTLFFVSIFAYFYNWYQVFFPDNNPGMYWGVLWSLSVEEQFYVFYPPLLKCLGSKKRFTLWMGMVILSGLLWRWGVYLAGTQQASLSVKASFGAFDQIAFGCLLYGLNLEVGAFLSKHRNISVPLCLSGIFILIQTYLITHGDSLLDLVYGPTLIALGAFLFLLGGLHLPFFESKVWTIFTLPGKYSYSLYLLHTLIFYIIFPWLVGLNVFTAFSLYVLIATALGAFSYQFFELPANHWVRKQFLR